MFSAFFIERPKFAMVIAIVMTLAGALAIATLPVTEYPAISPPNITVSGVYPGASAEIVEAAVGVPIEDAVNGVEDMIYMSSKSANDGSYRLTITFRVGADPDMALVRVQNRVKLAEPSLPTEVTAMGLTISERSPDAIYLPVIPDDFLPELADEPRYQALLEQMNLPPHPSTRSEGK